MKQLVLVAMIGAFAVFAGSALADNLCGHAMQYAPVAISTATTTRLVTGSTNNRVVVCGYDFTVGGTTPTYQFEYGTKASTDCDTGATVMTGAYAPTSGTKASFGGANQSIMATATSKDLCLVTVGTGASVQGVIDYVVIP